MAGTVKASQSKKMLVEIMRLRDFGRGWQLHFIVFISCGIFKPRNLHLDGMTVSHIKFKN
jgi:hypothetical protein